jgi:signal transduction histidine kinase
LSSISRSSGIRVFVCVPIVNDNRVLGAVLLSRTPTSILQALYGKRYLLAQAALVILAVVVAVALFASRMIARPLAGLARDAERIAQGEPNTLAEAPTPRTHEIAKLQASVIAMAQSLEQRAAYVSELSRHVSHEFKTPLTAIRGAVEVLRDHGGEMTEHERARFLENIGADADRLHRLTQRLLDLARADMASFATAPLDVGSLLTGIAAGERDTGLRIKLDVPAQPLLADSNEIVLTAALGCLLDNAAEHGATCVRMSAACTGHRIEVRVEDDGPGISAANRERVFQPFFTTARDRGGTGLGLTITAALLKRAGGDIALLDTCGGLQEHQLSGATFVVSLPAG